MVMALNRFRAPVIILLCVTGVLLCARLSTMAFSHLLQSRHPSLAASLDTNNVTARFRLINTYLSSDPPLTSQAKERAQQVLRTDPLSSSALVAMAVAAAEDGNHEEARTLLGRASALSLRPDHLKIWSFRNALSAGNYTQVFEIIGRVYKISGSLGVIAGFVPAIIQDTKGLEASVDALSHNPEWRNLFLNAMLRQDQLHGQGYVLYEKLLASAAPPSEAETRTFLDAFVRGGNLTHAEALWRLSQSRAGAPGESLFPNAGFENGLTNSPFDWTARRDPRAAVRLTRENRRRVLNVDFFGGRVAESMVGRLMALPPGAYILTGVERAASFSTPRGLAWRVTCRGQTTIIGESEAIKDNTEWRSLSVKFDVPDDCPYQMLELRLLARLPAEQEVRGVVSYADFSLDSRAQ